MEFIELSFFRKDLKRLYQKVKRIGVWKELVVNQVLVILILVVVLHILGQEYHLLIYLRCYVPSKEIFIEYDDKLQKEVSNENTMDKIMLAEDKIKEDKIMESLKGIPLPKHK